MKPVIFHDFTNNNNKGTANQQDFFQEYFKNFETFEHYHRACSNKKASDQKLLELNIKKLEEIIHGLRVKFDKLIKGDPFPDVVFISGSGSWDGHGIIVNSRSVVFFDMERMNQWIATPGFAIDTHVAHEIFHALHYGHMQEFYPGNYLNIEGKVIKRMFAEGLATYLSSKLTEVPIDRGIWLGILNDDQCNYWFECARNARAATGVSLQHILAKAEDCDNLATTLFTVPGFSLDDLLRGRFGYYFGAEIAKSLEHNYSDFEMLDLTFCQIRQHVIDYFLPNNI